MTAPPLELFDLPTGATAAPIPGGLINQTWRVDDAGEPVAVVQRLHPVFAPEVNLDIDAVTGRLAEAGLETPRLIPARSGQLWVEHGGQVFRALTFVPGTTIHAVDRLDQARSAGELIGRFHRALDGFDYDYRFTRAGVHDTAAHLDKLRGLADADDTGGEAAELAAEILGLAGALPPLPSDRRRHCHGDLKISNVLFDDTWRARCLVDLDTVGLQTIAYELGDAMRSWCNPAGEDRAHPTIDLAIFEAGLTGYAAGAGDLLHADEIASIAPGLATVCLELAARFAADVYEDRYFGWDAGRFPSRRAHNLVRARGQLSLARSALDELGRAAELARAAFL